MVFSLAVTLHNSDTTLGQFCVCFSEKPVQNWKYCLLVIEPSGAVWDAIYTSWKGALIWTKRWVIFAWSCCFLSSFCAVWAQVVWALWNAIVSFYFFQTWTWNSRQPDCWQAAGQHSTWYDSPLYQTFRLPSVFTLLCSSISLLTFRVKLEN